MFKRYTRGSPSPVLALPFPNPTFLVVASPPVTPPVPPSHTHVRWPSVMPAPGPRRWRRFRGWGIGSFAGCGGFQVGGSCCGCGGGGGGGGDGNGKAGEEQRACHIAPGRGAESDAARGALSGNQVNANTASERTWALFIFIFQTGAPSRSYPGRARGVYCCKRLARPSLHPHPPPVCRRATPAKHACLPGTRPLLPRARLGYDQDGAPYFR